MSLTKRLAMQKMKLTQKQRTETEVLGDLIKDMSKRDTKANIRNLKEELRNLKVMEGVSANTTSHSKLQKDRSDMAR